MALFPCIFYNSEPITEKIYGVYWDGTSTKNWTRTDDAENFSNPNPYYEGMSETPSSPFDNLMPWAGMQIVEDDTVGTLVSIPKFWYKITQDNTTYDLKIQISDSEIEGFSVSPAHMDRGDGNGERDVVYIGKHLCTSDYKSISNANPISNTTRSTFRTNIHNLGSNIWQQDYAIRFTIWLLYLVEYASWDSQGSIGYGCSTNGIVMASGYTNNMPYHTGTTASARTSYGGTQYRYIEGLWDNLREWIDGCYYNANGLNIIMNPSDFSDGSNGIPMNAPSYNMVNVYPSKFLLKEITGTFPLFVPSGDGGGSDASYSCDYWNYGGAAYPVLLTGGYSDRNLWTGLFYISYDTASDRNYSIGSRIMKLP